MKENIIIKKDDIFLTKKLIILNSKLNEYTQNNNKYKLLSYFEEIISYKNGIYLIYINRKNIHKILYEEQECINIENKDENTNLNFLFYLCLLINNDKNIINYQYSFEYINNIFIKNKEEKKNFKKIIIAKIIFDLIYNYKNSDKYNEMTDEKKLNIIEKQNLDIIKNINNINELNLDLDENKLKEKNIDLIYIDIIKALFLKNDFKNIENIEQILNQLDLELINITANMLDELLKILNDDFLKEYNIEDIEDLFNINKINFYFILFKYIIKNSIIIYQIPFLLKIKKIIINLINNKLDEFSNFNFNEEINRTNNKIEYVLERTTDSEYYSIKLQLKYVKEYYQNFFFESKEDDIKKIEDILKNNKLCGIKKEYLMDYKNAQKFNERYNLLKYLFEQKSGGIEISKIKLKNEWENLENIIKQKNFEQMNVNDIIIMNYYLKYNEELFINIFDRDIYKCLIDKIQNINNNNPLLVNSISTNNLDSNKTILPENDEDEDEDEDNKKHISYFSQNYSHSKGDNETESKDGKKEENKVELNYPILEFNKIIGRHKNSSESIKEINNQIIVSCGTDNNIIIYENQFETKQEINCKAWINNIEDFDCIDFIKYKIIIGTKDLLLTKNLITNKEDKIEFEESKMKLHYFFKVKNENNKNNSLFFLCKENEVSSLKYLTSKIIIPEKNKILEGFYKEGIQIDKTLFAFTSNKIVIMEKIKLLFII